MILATGALLAFGPASGVLAQGSINLDNSQSTGRLSIDAPGNYYGGVYGVEVWEMSGARLVPPGINGVYPIQAYNDMVSAGFKRVAIFSDQNNSSTPGIIRLGELDIPDVVPKGATVVIALAMWNDAEPTWEDAGWFGVNLRLGVLAFVNATADYTAIRAPAPPALSGWTSDLIMSIPEPSTVALAGVGAAAWLMLRRSARRTPLSRTNGRGTAAGRTGNPPNPSRPTPGEG